MALFSCCLSVKQINQGYLLQAPHASVKINNNKEPQGNLVDYTITVIRQDRTDVQPQTYRATRTKLLLLLAFIVGLPLFGFWVSYSYIAPQRFAVNMKQLKEDRNEATSSMRALEAQYDVIVEENETLRTDLQIERRQRAELEAKMTNTETARQEAGERLADLEEEVVNLQQSVKFYEDFLKPKNEQAPLQCFNIRTEMKKGRLSYGVSFMKNNQKGG